VDSIAEGRRGLATRGSAEAGLVSYQDGLAKAMTVFQEAAASGDARTLILVEEAYVVQERAFCDPADAAALNSLQAAATGFDEALRVLPTVADAAAYRAAETTYPHDKHYRYKGAPKDAFHVACISHRARLGNTLRTPGMNMQEKAIYQQRQTNMTAVQEVYYALQEAALGGSS
jgi:hypothetical protein